MNLLDVIATLSETRDEAAVGRAWDISYSTIKKWEGRIAENRFSYNEHVLYQYMIRANKKEIEYVMQRYGLESDVDNFYLSEAVFDEAFVNAYAKSSIRWKQSIISFLHTLNMQLLAHQLTVINAFIEGLYPSISIPSKALIGSVDPSDISHL